MRVREDVLGNYDVPVDNVLWEPPGAYSGGERVIVEIGELSGEPKVRFVSPFIYK